MDAALRHVLGALDARPTVAAYLQAARQIKDLSAGLQPVRVALLSTFTVDQLVPYLAVEAARRGFALDAYVAPFDSVRQELLDQASGCARHDPDVVFITHMLDDVCPPLAREFLGLDAAQRAAHVEAIVADLLAALTAFRRHQRAAVVVGNFAKPPYPPLGIYEALAPDSLSETTAALNARLVAATRGLAGVQVLDFDRLCADVGYRHAFDGRMWHVARAPLSAALLPTLASAQAAMLTALVGTPRKCLVLDLDNTLWGGVLGEAGVAGIKLGHSHPGNMYVSFQQSVLELHRRGVLLAINSKNNPADVEEVFRSHPDMVLKREHFASMRINWRDKPANMLEIAAELNIAPDSLVFFDDSPVERQLMTDFLPEVQVIDVPPDPSRFVAALWEARPFDRLGLTDEDRRRGDMYRRQAARQQTQAAAASLEEFLASLQMTARIRRLDQFAAPRVLDLLQKTNQFNLTTRRHSASDLDRMAADPSFAIFTLQVLDRFGDEGIVGVAVVEKARRTARIDSLLLSCRVIGRTVETALLAFLAEWSRAQGLDLLEGEFLPTAKNAPARDCYPRHGFAPLEDGRWRLDLASATLSWPPYITRDVPTAEPTASVKS